MNSRIPLPSGAPAALILRWRHVLIFAALLGAACASALIAFLLRFEFRIPPEEFHHLAVALAIAALVKMPVFYIARGHRGWFQFSGVQDLQRILLSCLSASMMFASALFLIFGSGFPRSIYVLDAVFTVAIVCLLRMCVRVIREARSSDKGGSLPRNVLIYGAGSAGVTLAREIKSNLELRSRVVGFLDDSPHMAHEYMLGLPIWKGGENTAPVVDSLRGRGISIDEILIAVPSAKPERMSAIVAACRSTGIPCRTLPGVSDLLQGRHLRTQMRDIRLEDLLARETITLEEDAIRQSLTGKCVMITGAAGSIGSELASHVAQFNPRKLILFDFAESQLFYIDQRMRSEGHGDNVVCIIGDIRDVDQLEAVVRQHEVEAIFHAAAYKHVPLMEKHVVQAAINNVVGTFNVAEVAYRFGVKSFTLISSDKAVNPTSVMGATKRAAELIVCSYAGGSTKFSSVRFGNVLGSNGSVVPLFQSQIARGGPLTVTHPDVTRYFMTVQEAVQLVLQASTMGKGREIFVLDMGQPVRIYDLAQNVIRLAGLRPETDIKINFVGLRPGEKLYEELIAEGENTLPTHHKNVKIFKGPVPDRERIVRWLNELLALTATKDSEDIVRHLANLIPEYAVSDKWERSRPLPVPTVGIPLPEPLRQVGAANV